MVTIDHSESCRLGIRAMDSNSAMTEILSCPKLPYREAHAGAVHWLLILVMTACFASPPSLFGQRYTFKFYGEDEGLRNLAPQCLLQDRSGFLWVGTQDGLYRYDGRRFRAFGRNDGLPSALIYSLHETADGKLWIDTAAGLARRDGDRFEPVATGVADAALILATMASDRVGRLYVATYEGLLIGSPDPTQPAGLKFEMLKDPAVKGRTRGVSVDESGSAWFGAEDRICQLSGGQVTVWGKDRGVVPDRWDAVKIDPAGTVWIRSRTRLLALPRGTSRFVPRDDGLPPYRDYAHLFLDRQGEPWIPTDEGLAHRIGDRWRIVGPAQGLEISSVNQIFLQDREGSIWIGISGTGLARWLGYGESESWTKTEGLADAIVWCIARDTTGHLWAGTERGLNQLDPESGLWKLVTVKPLLEDSRITGLLPDPDGSLWVAASQKGLVRLDSTGRRAQLCLPADRIVGMLLDSNHRLWAATTNGLFRSGPAKEPIQFEAQSLLGSTSDYLGNLIEDQRGRIWVAGRKGLSVLEGSVWKRYTTGDGLASNLATRVAARPDGSVWIAYREGLGLAKLTPLGQRLSIETYTVQSGLNSNKVVFLATDRRGWLWVGGDSGVSITNGNAWSQYGRPRGLIWSDCSSDAFFADLDGTVWIGTSRGITHFSPGRDPFAAGGSEGPRVLITEVRLGSDRTPLRPPSILEGTERPAQVKVPYEDHTFEVSFAALTFVNERAVRFRYRLSGLENQWKETDQWEARYAGLAPGQYTFEVEARNASGPWSAAPAQFLFAIEPPFWMTWWFRSLLVLATIFFLGMFWRRHRLLDAKRYLEAAVVERTRALIQAQEALRHSNELLETTIRAAPVGIVALDIDGKVKLWNKMTESTFGWKQDEVLDKPLPFLSGEKQWDFSVLLDRVLQGEAISEQEATYSRKDGVPISASLSAAPLRNMQGEASGALLVFEDVTERKTLESQLFQSQKLESIGRLAGGIAHDFNNILTIINGYSDMALSKLGEDHPSRQNIQQVRKSGEKAANLTEQLLVFSRKRPLEMKPLDLNMTVVDIEKMLRRLIGEDIQMITALDPALGTIMGDAGQIHQVIMNLAVNARDAMPNGGKLLIETANVDLDRTFIKRHPQIQPGPHVMLSVSDTGIGMDEETKSHIFEPFFTTKEEGKGTGLGLATVYGIVRQSGGWIWVYSELGRGSVFKIYFPRCDAQVSEGRPAPVEIEKLRGTERILLAEDDQGVLSLVSSILNGLGYTVLEASTGEEAITIAERETAPIDLLVSDIVMPGMSGYDLSRQLKELRPRMRVLLISGYTDRTVSGADEIDPNTPYLQKPFTSISLAAKIREVLAAAAENPDANLHG
jgi:PAS domain S-box-containing protein